ncbi:MAG TPA: alpha-galactosidase, partial [Chitinophagaceae bacterium]|nr:alpha-galactosidase [Chitinophagaceae bacterium]
INVKKLILFVFAASLSFFVLAQNDSITIENNTLARKFYFSKDTTGFYTKTFTNKTANENYVNPATEEFNITVNGVLVNGLNCKHISHSFKDSNAVHTLTVTLETMLPKVYLQLVYEMYEDIPLVRKQLKVINKGTADLALTNLDVENLRFQVVDKYMNEVYANYGTNITRIPYKSDYNDAAVLLFNLNAKQGAIFGNEAPSVLKNTEIYTNIHGCIQMGMRHINETFPFKKLLQPGETFSSPKTFIYVFNSGKWQDGFEGRYKEFVRKYLGVCLFTKEKKPLFLYNTWKPFLDTLDEKLIMHAADTLAVTGTDVFIIDAGWYKYSGDFIPDSSKFPNGIKSVCDYIRSKGMQVGLWFTIAGVNAKSKVATLHPEWLIKDKDGNAANLHDMSIAKDGYGWNSALKIMSLGSPYYDYIKKMISSYIKDLGIAYLKLDLSIANSAYVHDTGRTGDYETNPAKLYRDRASSYWVIYERIMQLMDEFHKDFPGLLIDCTFETWGRYNIADYALIEHADYDWLTNFEFEPPVGPIAIRQMNYDRSRVMPVSTLLIGNQYMNFPNYKYVYFSLASASLVMVGDPRKLTAEQQTFYKKWNNYLKQMEDKYQYTSYFQLYDIFDRPTDNN